MRTTDMTASRWISWMAVAAIVSVSLLAAPAPAQAASPIYVTTWRDENDGNTSNGACSLREAVISANENRSVGGCGAGSAGADEIILPANLKDEYNIERNFEVELVGTDDTARLGDIDILESLTITGQGASRTVIKSDGSDRIFHIINLRSQVVTIRRLALTGGSSNSGGGGAVLNDSSVLVLSDVLIQNNIGDSIGGGGVRSRNTIIDDDLVGSTVKIYNSMIDTNSTTGNGGGILNDGNLEIANTLVAHNTAKNGGGLSNIISLDFSALLTNVTFTENYATTASGIYFSGRLRIVNSTIYSNLGAANGIEDFGTNSVQLTLANTIIAGHVSSSGANCNISNTDSTVSSNGHNLEDQDTCRLNPGQGDMVNTPTGLVIPIDPLGVYGLEVNSAAVDHALNADCPATDQRGVNYRRPADGDGNSVATCDIGAFELGALPPLGLFIPSIRK